MGNSQSDFFERIYDNLYHKVTAYVIIRCNSILDVEDIVQDTFTELYKIVKSKGQDFLVNPEAMAMRIANFKTIKYYKQKQKKNEMSLVSTNSNMEVYSNYPLSDIDIEAQFVNEETIREIWSKLKQKPCDIQKIFALFYYCDLTIREIAMQLNVSETSVKHRLYRTLQELRGIYLKEGV